MQDKEHQVPIWFFIGSLLLVYGLLILGYGLFGPSERHVALAYLHADIWWGAVLVVLGGIYVIRFRPGRNR